MFSVIQRTFHKPSHQLMMVEIRTRKISILFSYPYFQWYRSVGVHPCKVLLLLFLEAEKEGLNLGWSGRRVDVSLIKIYIINKGTIHRNPPKVKRRLAKRKIKRRSSWRWVSFGTNWSWKKAGRFETWGMTDETTRTVKRAGNNRKIQSNPSKCMAAWSTYYTSKLGWRWWCPQVQMAVEMPLVVSLVWWQQRSQARRGGAALTAASSQLLHASPAAPN